MVRRWILPLLSVLLTLSLFAQVAPEPTLVEVPIMDFGPGREAAPTAASPARPRELSVLAKARGPIAANAVTSAGTNGELWLDGEADPFAGGILLRALAATPSVFTQLGTSSTDSFFSVNNAADASLFRIRGDGSAFFGPGNPWVRIFPNGHVALQMNGETPPLTRFLVQHGTDNQAGMIASHQTTFEVGSPSPQMDQGLIIQTTQNVQEGASNGGSMTSIQSTSFLIGPGTLGTALGGIYEVGTRSNPPTASLPATLKTAIAADMRVTRAPGSTVENGYGLIIRDIAATRDYALYAAGADDTSIIAGDLILGTAGVPGRKLTVNGDANFTGTVTGGNIQAHYQDVAEWVPSREDLAPGTVVVLDRERTNEVVVSSQPYDTAVAGVVSAQPGLLLGVASDDKEMIATTGRVLVRVDARRAPIAVGDLLVTSDTPGVAMKSIPVEVSGIAMHRPGTIVGKALQALPEGEGEILVLLSLQ